MSDPARQYPNHEIAGRPTPGPLRDWLAAMKAVTASQQAERSEAEPSVEPLRPMETARTAEAARSVEPAQSWTPRVVATPAAPEQDDDADMSDLMAENMMLKAKLRTEAGRYEDLQAILAHELRDLRSHVEEDLQEIAEVRAERDRLLELHTSFLSELQAARDQLSKEAEAVAAARSERDLWMARAETLAQPLFQRR